MSLPLLALLEERNIYNGCLCSFNPNIPGLATCNQKERHIIHICYRKAYKLNITWFPTKLCCCPEFSAVFECCLAHHLSLTAHSLTLKSHCSHQPFSNSSKQLFSMKKPQHARKCKMLIGFANTNDNKKPWASERAFSDWSHHFILSFARQFYNQNPSFSFFALKTKPQHYTGAPISIFWVFLTNVIFFLSCDIILILYVSQTCTYQIQ